MRRVIIRLIKLFTGTAILALGVVITMRANLGYGPWEVFHAGIGKASGMTIGNISILASLFICLVVVLMKEKFGLGAIVNLIVIGILLDVFLALDYIPQANGYVSGVVMLIIGLFIIAIGTYIYIGAGFGAGPRDSLMVVLKRKTGLPIGLCRGLVESTATWIGWMMGGPVGPGTVASTLGSSFCIQIVFMVMRFEATSVQHETVDETLKHLKGLFLKTPSSS